MSKKSFKRLQNRLYREIKHRMELERMATTVHNEINMLRIEKVKAGYKVPFLYYNDSVLEHKNMKEYARRHLARDIAEYLDKIGYIRYYAENYEFDQTINFFAEAYVVNPDVHKYFGG